MATNRSVLEILIKVLGGKASKAEISSLKKSFGGLTKVLGAFGIALGVREGVQLAVRLDEEARAAKDAEAALTRLLGSAKEYTRAIEEIKTTTNGMISETEAAQSAFGLLDNGIAQTAAEAAEYVQAGQALSAALGPSASYEKFLMLLDEGSDMLLNNFNITGSMVEQRQRLIEANTSLIGSEAKLQAIRELAKEKGLALATSISEETQAAAQFDAAAKDLAATLGELLAPAFEQSKSAGTGWAQAMTDWLQGVIEQHELEAAAMAEMGIEYQNLTSQARDAIKSSDEYQAALAKVVGETQKAQDAEERRAAFMGYYTSQLDEARAAQDQLNQSIGQSQQAIDASSARLAGLANAYNKLYGAGTADFTRTDPDQWMADQLDKQNEAQEAEEKAAEEREKALREQGRAIEQAAQEMAGIISSVLQPTLSEVWKPPEDDTTRIDEWARRMATVSTQGLSSEWLTQLQQQFGGADFFQPIAEAIESGDDTALREAANNILTTQVTQLWDKEVIKQRIRDQLQQQNIRDELIKEIQAELGAEGISTSIGVITAAAGDTTQAQAEVTTGLNEMAGASDAAAEKMAQGFDSAIKSVRDLNTELAKTAGLAEAAGDQLKRMGDQAANSGFYSGSPAGGPAADDRMGGDTPL